MSEIKEQFVGYEISLKLKELGFDEKCLGMYGSEFEFVVDESSWRYAQISKDVLQAPLWQQVIDWCDSKGLLVGTIIVDNLYKSTINKINYETELFHSRNESIKQAIAFAISYLQDNK